MLIMTVIAEFKAFLYILGRKSKFLACFVLVVTAGCEGERCGKAAMEFDSASNNNNNNNTSSRPHSPLPHQSLECSLSWTAMTKRSAVGRRSRLWRPSVRDGANAQA